MSRQDTKAKTRKDEKRQQNCPSLPPACAKCAAVIEGVRKETALLPVRLPEMQPTLMRRARDASRRLVLHCIVQLELRHWLGLSETARRTRHLARDMCPGLQLVVFEAKEKAGRKSPSPSLHALCLPWVSWLGSWVAVSRADVRSEPQHQRGRKRERDDYVCG